MKRVKPQNDRTGKTMKITLGRTTVYLTANTGKGGRVIELFGKSDEGWQGWLDALCLTASLALQYGCPLEKLMEKWRGTRFLPDGIGHGTSIPDAIARRIEKEQKHEKEREEAE